MIAAISYKVNDDYRIKLYPVGLYNVINWDIKRPCALGEEYEIYDYSNSVNKKALISVVKGLDDMYILRLIETKRYIIRVEEKSGQIIRLPHLQNEGNKFLRCDRDEDTVTFQFINYLGRSKILFDNVKTNRSIQFEVIPDKMSYEDDYIELTQSLADICSELLLDYTGSTSNMYSQSDDESKTLLEQFIFLRQFCFSQNIHGLFEAIKRNSDRVLVQEEEIRPFGSGIPSKKVFNSPFSYGRGWQKFKAISGNSYFIPQEIAVTKKKDSLNTAANRFIKYAFERFDSICIELINRLQENATVKQAECLTEAKAIHHMIDNICRDNFFDEIGTFDIMPQNNQVLQKREGYSQIFSAYSMIDMALKLDWKGKDAVYEGESKNVALLYEYWLFFELYKIIKSIDGCELCDSGETQFISTDQNGLMISLYEGKQSCQSFVLDNLNTRINLYYNRAFSPKKFTSTHYEGSYSRPFRPDYTLAIYPAQYCKGKNSGEDNAVMDGAVSYIHFDAKYRITDLTDVIGKTEIINSDKEFSEDKMESVVNTYKRGDLLKMHTYNDAIRRTVGSYVLYPGTEASSELGNATYKLYDEILPGVGAFAIKPSINIQGENELRTFIYSLIKAKSEYSSRLNRMKYYTEMVLKEPKLHKSNMNNIQIINSVTNTSGKMCVLGYIRADAEEDYYYSLKNNNLLKAGSKFMFYYYAIKGSVVYTHHNDISKATEFRFYKNKINQSGTYIIEPIRCKIESYELVSKAELVKRLIKQGYATDETRHHADFYFVLSVRVDDDKCTKDEFTTHAINVQNGNDSFSPHSPKVIYCL